MEYIFEIVQPTANVWTQINESCEQTIFHTKEWFDYLYKFYNVSPFICLVSHKTSPIAFFVGAKKWGGVNAILSPPLGTGTYTQGLVSIGGCTIHTEERIRIYREMADWLFRNRIAKYLKVDDWLLRMDSDKCTDAGTHIDDFLVNTEYSIRQTYTIDLTKSEYELWHNMYYKSCRYCINKAIKEGLTIHRITNRQDIAQFIKIHHEQICNVSQRKSEKTRTYQQERKLLSLCYSLFPSKVLLLQVKGKGQSDMEQIMASGIWLVGKEECIWWTGASWQQCQRFCPNELMLWEAIKILKDEGCKNLNLCGTATYKRKYGSTLTDVPRLIFRKGPHIILLDELIKTIYQKIQIYKRKIKTKQ